MIELLKISSMAIFDEVAIEFSPGLNCITGETGAGKSLVIGALTLLMGARANPGILSPGSPKCVIEALFSNGIDGETVIRREITSSGRNRCFINGDLVTVNQLGAKTAELIHIYGQHQYQDLLNPREHMRILEETADIERREVEEKFELFRQAAIDCRHAEQEVNQNISELENLRFSVEELELAAIEPDLESRIEQELEIARRAAELKNGTMNAIQYVYAENGSIVDQAAQAEGILRKLIEADNGLDEGMHLIETIQASAEELYLLLRNRHESYDFDQAWIDEQEERLQTIRALKRKYATDEDGLVRLLEATRQKLEIADDSSAHLGRYRQRLAAACSDYKTVLHDFILRRSAAGDIMAEKINRDLHDLGMQGTKLGIRQIAAGDIEKIVPEDPEQASPTKMLGGEFMISTNVGHDMQPLSQIASGGELSRIMLAIKTQQNENRSATMIFDEIDAGISGQTANMVACRLKDLTSKSQTIVVTHLHQVAALADSHLYVAKAVENNQTVSRVRIIDQDDRVSELARMMGGSEPTPAVLDHARELLSLN